MKPMILQLLWFLFLLPIGATDTAESSDASDSYDELPGYMMHIEVATKTSQLMSHVPGTTSIVTSKDFERLGLTTLEEVLRLIPGFHVNHDTSEGLFPTVHARGVYKVQGNGVLLLKDGFRVNDGNNNGALQHASNISLLNIERIEIIRGPGYTIYGENALFGVINLISAKQTQGVRVTTGSWERQGLAGSYSKKWAGLLCSLTFETDKDLGAHRNYQIGATDYHTRDPYHNQYFNLSIRGENWILDAAINDIHTWDNLISSEVRDDWNRHKTSQKRINVSKSWYLGDFKKVGLYLSNTHENSRERHVLTFPLEPEAPLSSFFMNEQVLSKNQSVRLEYESLGTKLLNYNIGFEFRDESFPINNFDGITPAEFNRYLESMNVLARDFTVSGRIPIWGIFLQNQMALSNNWNLTLGVRAEERRYSKRVHLYRVGLVRDTSRTTWKLHYGEGVRQPSPSDLSRISGQGYSFQHLEPERSRSGELSFWLKHGQHWQALTFHYLYDFNIVDFARTITPGEGVESKLNKYGFEWEGHARFKEGASLDLSFSRMLHMGSRRMPNWLGSLVYRSKGTHFWHLVEIQARDKTVLASASRSNATLNAKLFYRTRKGFEWVTGVNNLFDTSVREFSLGSFDLGFDQGVEQPGREWFASVSWRRTQAPRAAN